jgi:hypothetical protein
MLIASRSQQSRAKVGPERHRFERPAEPHPLAVGAGDLKAVGAPARVALRHGEAARVAPLGTVGVAGQPHRLRHLRRTLAHIAGHRERIWITTAGAIFDHVTALPPGTVPAESRAG